MVGEMTDIEAIKAISCGEKVAHKSFCDGEWVRQKSPTDRNYVFEDGVICTPSEFWVIRKDPIWSTGWRVV